MGLDTKTDWLNVSRNVTLTFEYLGVIFDKRAAWRLFIETIVGKSFRTFIRICSLFWNERLSANIKLTLH
jgi:hypothetical protein